MEEVQRVNHYSKEFPFTKFVKEHHYKLAIAIFMVYLGIIWDAAVIAIKVNWLVFTETWRYYPIGLIVMFLLYSPIMFSEEIDGFLQMRREARLTTDNLFVVIGTSIMATFLLELGIFIYLVPAPALTAAFYGIICVIVTAYGIVTYSHVLSKKPYTWLPSIMLYMVVYSLLLMGTGFEILGLFHLTLTAIIPYTRHKILKILNISPIL